MAVALSRHFWEHAWVGASRFAVTGYLFVLTGHLLSNQQSSSTLGFPTNPPLMNVTHSPMLLPAACFQHPKELILMGFDKSSKKFKITEFKKLFGSQLHGWLHYILLLICYIVSSLISLSRLLFRRSRDGSRKQKFVERIKSHLPSWLLYSRAIFFFPFGVYLVTCLLASTTTVVRVTQYIIQMRTWLKVSGW